MPSMDMIGIALYIANTICMDIAWEVCLLQIIDFLRMILRLQYLKAEFDRACLLFKIPNFGATGFKYHACALIES